MRKIRNFLLLPFQKKKLLLKSLLFVWLIRLGLWILPYKLLTKWLNSIGSSAAINEINDWKLIKEVSHTVRSCAKSVPFASCLTQALATKTLLRLNGQNSNLRIGVDKDENEKLIAHAWIEIDSKIIIGGSPELGRYTVLNSKNEQFV